MRSSSTITIAFLLLAAWALPAGAAEARRPLVLVFETGRGEGSDKELATSATKALRNYFRESQRVEATVFNRESPTVLRAIMEKKLTADKVASYSSQTERLEVAKALAFQYAAGAEIAIRDLKVALVGASVPQVQTDTPPSGETDKKESAPKNPVPTRDMRVVEIKLWLAQVDGGKNARWEAVGSAEIGGPSAADMENTLQSAASSAVLDVSRRAFAQLPLISEPGPITGRESTAIGADQPTRGSEPTASDYASKADESLKQGNFAVAIEQYLKAVNADSANGALRVRLAEAYARRAMFREADDQMARAKENGADAGLISAAKDRIEQLKNGPPPSTIKGGEAPPLPGNRVRLTPDRPAAAPAIAKIIEGDKLWNSGEPDQAAEAYRESIKINPNDWRALERLAAVTASMSLFGESRKILDQLGKTQPEPSPALVANRYQTLRGYFDLNFSALLRQYESAGTDFDKKTLTRESYYSLVKGLAIRLESMASFLDALTAPPIRQPAHLRRSLACGLAAQASSSLLNYLETNSEKSKSNAATFASQAKSELQSAEKLDENKVVVEQKPAPSPPPAPEPAPEPAPTEQPAPEPPPAQ